MLKKIVVSVCTHIVSEERPDSPHILSTVTFSDFCQMITLGVGGADEGSVSCKGLICMLRVRVSVFINHVFFCLCGLPILVLYLFYKVKLYFLILKF